jgi:putative flippase GtrA
MSPPSVGPVRMVAFFRTDHGRRTLRYATVSVIAIVVSQIAIAVTYGGFLTSKTVAQTVAAILSTIPSYELNRRWVWGRNGKSSKSREVVPFWIISLAQFAISLIAINFLGGWMEAHVASHLSRTLWLQSIVLCIYGAMWVAKFAFFNRVLFADRPRPSIVTG